MKKLNKFFAVLVALAMMATLCVSMAFAADDNAITGGTKTDPATATMTKTLVMPNGVTNPNKEFTFSFVQTIQDLSDAEVTDDGYVDDAAVTDGVFTKAITPTNETTAEDEGTVVGKSANVFGGITWPKAGVYEFTVTEVKPANAETPIVTNTNPIADTDPVQYKTKTTEIYDYSEAEFKVYVGVASDNGTLYVESIAVKQTKNDAGQPINPAPKVPATDPGNNAANGFNFTNKYNKSVENTPTGTTPDGPGVIDDESLFVEKTIVNEDETDVTTEQKGKEFRMNVTVTFPTNGTKTSYTAKRVDATGTQIGDAYTFTKTDATKVVPLKYGERLVFTDIEYGASWTVTEDAYPAYSAGYTTTNNGLVKDSADNKTVVTNTYDKEKDPATGLSIANLPFIVLALVAVGGLVAYVVVRRKSEDNA